MAEMTTDWKSARADDEWLNCQFPLPTRGGRSKSNAMLTLLIPLGLTQAKPHIRKLLEQKRKRACQQAWVKQLLDEKNS
jgi:hypothetical protein